jgi:hypothetical protein
MAMTPDIPGRLTGRLGRTRRAGLLRRKPAILALASRAMQQ